MEAIEKYDACVKELKAYADGAGFTDCVLGLSGGIDSSVTAPMCVDAFGVAHVHGYMLPGPYSTDHSIDDGRALAENLGIEAHVVSIKQPYEAFAETLAPFCGGALEGTASQNTQARCRMIVLMALSNTFNWMLVNTGNKSEAMMGYSTLYGDTAGAFAPLGGLYKTDVYAVGRARNERAAAAGEVPPIPEHVFVKPPSAELAPGQQDEKSLGIDYATLDRILIGYFEQWKPVEEIAASDLPVPQTPEQVQAIVDRASKWDFKRAMEPPFPHEKFY